MQTLKSFWQMNCGRKTPSPDATAAAAHAEITQENDPGVRFIIGLQDLNVGERSNGKEALVRTGIVFEKMNEKLKTTGSMVQLKNASGTAVTATMTGVQGIFRQPPSPHRPEFLVFLCADDPSNFVERSREEVETHLLLESYLNTQGRKPTNPSCFQGQFISVSDLAKNDNGASGPNGLHPASQELSAGTTKATTELTANTTAGTRKIMLHRQKLNQTLTWHQGR